MNAKQKRALLLPLVGLGAVAMPLIVNPAASAGAANGTTSAREAQTVRPGRGARSPQPARDTRKNILMILVDDLGYKDTGFTGSDFYETPAIDSLSRLGLIFNISYTGGANSAPSRACLISGQYTPRHGVYAVDNTTRGPKDQMRLLAIPNNDTLPRHIYTVANALQAAGYNTSIVGKWHLGDKAPYTPAYRGFMVDQSEPVQTTPDFKLSNDPKNIFEETDKICAQMEQSVREGKPFFAYMAFHAVHEEWRALPEYINYFKAKPPGKLHHEVVYAAMIKHLDDAVRIITAKVRELGVADNTVIVFTSDNGGIPKTSQAPLRGFKGCFYEGGIRVPTFIIYPGGVKGSTDVPIINVDYYPTFVQIARAKLPADKILDGESLLPLLTGKAKTLKRDAIFWHFPGYLDRPCPGGPDTVFRQRPSTMIRKGDWKLVLYHEPWVLDGGRAKLDTNHAVELFNLRDDISETTDLSNIDKAKRDELLDDLLQWMDKTGAKMAQKFTPETRAQLLNKGKKVKDPNDGE